MKDCIICGTSVHIAEPAPEIISCSSDICIHTIENSIGLHYQAAIEPTIVATHYGISK